MLPMTSEVLVHNPIFLEGEDSMIPSEVNVVKDTDLK